MKVPGSQGSGNLGAYIQEKLREAQGKYKSQQLEREDSTKKTGQASQAGKGALDEVSISERARDVQKARVEMDKVPEVRMQRIEELRTAIAANEYHVDAKDIADKILRDHLIDLFQ